MCPRYELVRHCRRARDHRAGLQDITPIVLVFESEPPKDFLIFITNFPYIFYFIGSVPP